MAYMQHMSLSARFVGPTWGTPGSCRPQVGPMLAPWNLLFGVYVLFVRNWTYYLPSFFQCSEQKGFVQIYRWDTYRSSEICYLKSMNALPTVCVHTTKVPLLFLVWTVRNAIITYLDVSNKTQCNGTCLNYISSIILMWHVLLLWYRMDAGINHNIKTPQIHR